MLLALANDARVIRLVRRLLSEQETIRPAVGAERNASAVTPGPGEASAASEVVLAWRREHIDHLAGLKHCDRVLDLTGYDVTVPGA